MMLTDCRFWTERLTTTGNGTSALVPRGPVAKTTLSLPSVTAPPTRTRRSCSSVRRSFTRAHNCMRRTRSHARKGAVTLTSYSLTTAPRCSSKTGRERNDIERERAVERDRSEKSSAHGSTQRFDRPCSHAHLCIKNHGTHVFSDQPGRWGHMSHVPIGIANRFSHAMPQSPIHSPQEFLQL
jgi:hypothetical protein